MNANTKLPLPATTVEPVQSTVDIHDRVIEAYYGKLGPQFMRDTQERIHWICRHVEGTTALDVGCSQGIVPILLAREGVNVIGIDTSPKAIEEASQYLQNEPGHVQKKVSFINADFLSHDFGGIEVSTVVMSEVLEHLVQPHRFVESAAKRLPANGRLVVTVPFGINDFIDHKQTFYLLEPFKLIAKYFDIVEIEVLGKWLGITANRRNSIDPQSIEISLTEFQIQKLEDAFFQIERRLRDDLATTRKKLDDANQKYRGATEQISALKQRVGQEEAARKAAEDTAGQSTAKLKHAQVSLNEERTALQQEIARLRAEEKDNSTKAHEAEKQVTRLLAELELVRGRLDEANQKYSSTAQQANSLEERLVQEVSTRKAAEDALSRVKAELALERTTLQEERSLLQQEIARLSAEIKILNAAAKQAQSEFSHLNAELDSVRQQLEQANLKYRSSTERMTESAENLASLEKANKKHEETIRKLQRAEQVKSARINALERRANAALESGDKVRATLSFQLGYALIHGFKSWRSVVRLPRELWRIRQEAGTRRQQPKVKLENAKVAASTAQIAAPSVSATVNITLPVRTRQRQPLEKLLLDLKNIRVAAIMDEFTFHSFKSECDLYQIRPDSWEQDLITLQPDIMFIESAWRGVEDLWATKVSNASPEIMGVIDWCLKNAVPTVFWNKEDPVHFGGFLHIARAVDYVFTTDIDCIARYKREVGHDRVYLLPFAAQPVTHNPVELYDRKDAFNFAGSYYLRYPERQRDFKSIIDVAGGFRPVEIYDRNFNKPHPHYQFPDEYKPYILGNLPFDQIDKAYKGYRYGINMNTIKYSQTMFARRVFELLASNTVVISNFSRGMRLLFGDLVISSDAPVELRRRLETVCKDDLSYRKYRLAGLRKVMSEHTYAHRLAYIVSKITGVSVRPSEPKVCMLGFPRTQAEAQAMVRVFEYQTYSNRLLYIVGNFSDLPASERIRCVPTAEAATDGIGDASFVAAISARDYYGPNYIKDLALATSYCDSSAIGKAAQFVVQGGNTVLENAGQQYQQVDRLRARASIIKLDLFTRLGIRSARDLDEAYINHDGAFSTDEFNYCRASGLAPSQQIVATVNDMAGLDQGLSWLGDLAQTAERIPAATDTDSGNSAARLPGIDAKDLYPLLPENTPENIDFTHDGDNLVITSDVASDKHQYIYLTKRFTRKELNLELNSRFHLLSNTEFDLRTVFEFQDEHGKKIAHSMNAAGAAHSLAIPNHCQKIRIGLRVQGSGTARISRLILGDCRERPSILLPKSKSLVLTKQYPAYDDLYRYGFLHSRVRAYRDAGLRVDVFRITSNEDISYREFEGFDIVSGDDELLDSCLASGAYDHVLVHLMDNKMWNVLRKHIDNIRVTVWIHGAEIQVWQRREFEFERLSEDEINRQKKLSDQRVKFWRDVLVNPSSNLELIFVSQYFANEVAKDLGIDFSGMKHRIIHNYIDTGLFAYSEKSASMRTKILSIRPYASRKYANDLTVRAILELAKRPFFKDLEFRLVGDGDLFDEITAPLVGFKNVILDKRFLTHAQIAATHKEYGIFLTPTRMDAQGVSRDEAMSSGLVPITTRVAAIPEFVDESSGIVVEAEDYVAMADGIERLYREPSYFKELSRSAATRVRSQCDYAQTIQREINLINDSDNDE